MRPPVINHVNQSVSLQSVSFVAVPPRSLPTPNMIQGVGEYVHALTRALPWAGSKDGSAPLGQHKYALSTLKSLARATQFRYMYNSTCNVEVAVSPSTQLTQGYPAGARCPIPGGIVIVNVIGNQAIFRSLIGHII